MTNKQLQSHISVFTANTIFGIGIPVTSLLLMNWVTPGAYMTVRCVCAAVIFWIISWFTKDEKPSAGDLLVICGGGLLGVVVSQYLTALALSYTTPFYFSLVAGLTPVVTLLCAGVLIGERIRRKALGGMALSVLGAVFLTLMGSKGLDGTHNLLGIVLTFLSVLTWVIYLIITRKVSARYTAVTQMKWIFLTASVVYLPFFHTELAASPLFSTSVTWEGIAQMSFIVVFATVGGYFAIPFAMRHLKATTVSVYTNLQPVVASLVSIGIGIDAFSWDKPLILILILSGVYLVSQDEQG